MDKRNVRDDLKNIPTEEIQSIQRETSLPYAVCCLNVTGDLNVGMILRTACLFGAERAFVFGRRRYDRRSTVGAQNYLDIVPEYGLTDQGEIDNVKFYSLMNEYRYLPVFVEIGGTPIQEFNVPKGIKPCFVFGNEGMGIPKSLLENASVCSIDQIGVLRSLNVSTTAGIVLHHAMLALK